MDWGWEIKEKKAGVGKGRVVDGAGGGGSGKKGD